MSCESAVRQLSAFHVEVDKSGEGYRVLVSDVRRVIEVSDFSIKLKCRVGSVFIRGKILSLSVYENKTVEVSGKIEALEFSYGKN